MAGDALSDGGWTLRPSKTRDIAELMGWFDGEDDVVVWGGPGFRYPFTRASFFEDIHWGRMLSYSLRSPDGSLVGFGQLYDRDQHIHLARLIVAPASRGQGAGRRLIEMLMQAGSSHMPHDRYSLFVFRDNKPAYECYRSLGFEVGEYPKDMPHADVCYFLTRTP